MIQRFILSLLCLACLYGAPLAAAADGSSGMRLPVISGVLLNTLFLLLLLAVVHTLRKRNAAHTAELQQALAAAQQAQKASIEANDRLAATLAAIPTCSSNSTRPAAISMFMPHTTSCWRRHTMR